MIRFLLKVLRKVLVVLIVAWVIGLYWFAKLIPLYNNDLPSKVDAMVVLTGAGGRLETGLSLLSNVTVGRMLVSGVGKNTTINDIKNTIFPSAAKILENKKHKIDLGYLACSTGENALEANEWVKNNKFNSIILVTSNYHMPRSLKEFNDKMSGIKVYPYSVFSTNFNAAKWYESSGSIVLVVSEYNKYLISMFKK